MSNISLQKLSRESWAIKNVMLSESMSQKKKREKTMGT
jgi:hypothetical protein